jgi:predicted ATPase
VKALLAQPGARLVTLTGTGGVGKTRLAIQVAIEVAPAFAHGGQFVALAGLQEPALVIPAIAQSLAVHDVGDEPLGTRLAGYLHGRQLLLLLDNFEHVGAAAPEVAALLAACPRLVILVTSRASLHLQGEHEWPVAPLVVPALGDILTLEVLGQVSAVALVVQRAKMIKPDFALTEANAAAVAATCRRLDGLPLALELAAARLKVLSPGTLLSKLERRLALLTSGTLDLPERQRTLRGTIAWSYDLLRAEEQILFRRLAVFVGGATLEAVEAVWGQAGEDVLDGLTALIDHSLVQVMAANGAAEPRYTLLELVREYALEQLEAAGEGVAVRQWHLAWYLARAEVAASAPPGQEQRAVLENLEAERDNLQAALAWCARPDSSHTDARHGHFLRLATALAPFWEMQGPLSEGRRWLDAALATSNGPPARPRLPALAAAGRLAARQGNMEAAERWYGESLAGYRAVGDRRGMAAALTTLGQALAEVGTTEATHDRMLALFQEARDVWRELGDKEGTARALNGLAYVATERGESEVAVALLDESLALQRELGDAPGIAEALLRLGESVLDQGDIVRATELFEEHLARARVQGDTITVASALLSCGEVAMRRGACADAEALMAESLALSRKVDARIWMAGALYRSGELAAWQGHFEQAEVRTGEALAIVRDLGDRPYAAALLLQLARIVSLRGDHEQAVRLAQESLAMVRESGKCTRECGPLIMIGLALQSCGEQSRARVLLQDGLALYAAAYQKRHTWWPKGSIVSALAGLARIAATDGQLERAVLLYGASEACRTTAPFPLTPPDEEQRNRVLATVRATLGEHDFAATWTTGQSMSLDAAITYALTNDVGA